jgi:hypothetical protein
MAENLVVNGQTFNDIKNIEVLNTEGEAVIYSTADDLIAEHDADPTAHNDIRQIVNDLESQITNTDYVPTERTINGKALIEDIEITVNDINYNQSTLSDVLNTQSDKLDLIIGTTSNGQTTVISMHEENIEGWICTEGYWNGKYISTGV